MFMLLLLLNWCGSAYTIKSFWFWIVLEIFSSRCLVFNVSAKTCCVKAVKAFAGMINADLVHVSHKVIFLIIGTVFYKLHICPLSCLPNLKDEIWYKPWEVVNVILWYCSFVKFYQFSPSLAYLFTWKWMWAFSDVSLIYLYFDDTDVFRSLCQAYSYLFWIVEATGLTYYLLIELRDIQD